MILSKIENRYGKHSYGRVCQGDILKDVTFLEFVSLTTQEGNEYKYPYLVVLSQDCDLESDFGRNNNNSQIISEEQIKKDEKEETQDHKLHTILVCPAYDLYEFKDGKYLEALGIKMRTFFPKEIDKIKGNDEFKRFHYLHEEPQLGIPELIIDFKHFYTIPRDTIYEQYPKCYLATLNLLFREELSQRFAYYLSRIGVPVIESKRVILSS